MSDYYILDENKNAIPTTVEEWSKMFGDTDKRRVAETLLPDVRISTVFLGMNHNWGPGPPLLFETMTFERKESYFGPGPFEGRVYHKDLDQDRCSTWAEAEKMHANMVRKYMEGVPDEPEAA